MVEARLVAIGFILLAVIGCGSSGSAGPGTGPTLSPTGQVVATPKVEGLALARAKSTLVSSGLTVGQVLKQCDPAAAGTVIHQFPTVGLFLLRGLKVDLVVSSGACRG